MANNNRTEEVKKSQNEILDISDSSTNIRVTNENDDVVSTLEYADKRAQDAIEEQEKKEQTIKQKKKPTKNRQHLAIIRLEKLFSESNFR